MDQASDSGCSQDNRLLVFFLYFCSALLLSIIVVVTIYNIVYPYADSGGGFNSICDSPRADKPRPVSPTDNTTSRLRLNEKIENGMSQVERIDH